MRHSQRGRTNSNFTAPEEARQQISKTTAGALQLHRYEEICRAVRSFQQIKLPLTRNCYHCCPSANKIGRVKYILMLILIMIAPMEFNALSFLFSFSSPVDDIAYFDGCYVVTPDSMTWNLDYLECLACNNNLANVSTAATGTIIEGPPSPTIAIGLIGGAFALGIGFVYFVLAVRSLMYGALLAYGVYTEITPVLKSRPKIFILFVFGVYSAFVTYFSISETQMLQSLLSSLPIGNPQGGCYLNVNGVSDKDTVSLPRSFLETLSTRT
jgi:hypothetical protein